MHTFFQMLQAFNKPQLGMCNTFNYHHSSVVSAALKTVLALKIHRFCIVPLNWHSFLKTVYVFGPHCSTEATKNTFPYQLIFLCFDFEVNSKARFRGLSHMRKIHAAVQHPNNDSRGFLHKFFLPPFPGQLVRTPGMQRLAPHVASGWTVSLPCTRQNKQ